MSDPEEIEAKAKLAIHRVTREERALEKAAGRSWLQFLPLLTIVLIIVIAALGSLHQIPNIGWFTLPLIILQLVQWHLNQRLDAIQSILERRQRDDDEQASS